MIMKAIISSRELLDMLAENVRNPLARILVEVRIQECSALTAENLQLVELFITLVKRMNAEDLDMAHQSPRMRELQKLFVQIRNLLLEQMSMSRLCHAECGEL